MALIHNRCKQRVQKIGDAYYCLKCDIRVPDPGLIDDLVYRRPNSISPLPPQGLREWGVSPMSEEYAYWCQQKLQRFIDWGFGWRPEPFCDPFGPEPEYQI